MSIAKGYGYSFTANKFSYRSEGELEGLAGGVSPFL
nr:hypothetical protein [Synechococcus sp. BIOS-U3-1]